MEVKDVRSTKLIAESKLLTNPPIKPKSESRNVSQDAAATNEVRSSGKNQLRLKLNEVINVTNVAKDATSQIDNMVRSISGIIKQASKEDLPEPRRAALEKEANQLVSEIKKAAETKTMSGIRPLAGDKIRLEIEEKIGRTLDVILPDDAKNAFGISDISFSTRDSIISTIASVEMAEQNIMKLKNAVEEASRNLLTTADTLDVALQNSEASESSIRDLEQALTVTGEMRSLITDDPKKALDSVSKLSLNSVGLLE